VERPSRRFATPSRGSGSFRALPLVSALRAAVRLSAGEVADLEQIRRTRGVEILLINLPVLHLPVGECYNVRYGQAVLADFVAWAASDARLRGLDSIRAETARGS
jgi:hypothetical protein